MGRPKAGESWILESGGGQEFVIVHHVDGQYAQVSIPGSEDEDALHEVSIQKLTLQQ